MPEGKVLAISGIDTDIGKTIATGLLGRYLRQQGYSVITQKIAQTGCSKLSEDILRHRQLMGIDLQDADHRGLTCPYIFPEPCSPHLAAALAGGKIDSQVITAATRILRQQYDFVLLEGVGGLSVPLAEDWTVLDYLENRGYPLILVSSPRLGSINHTLAALELARGRRLQVMGILYNRFQKENKAIAEDSARVFSRYLRRYGFADHLVDVLNCDVYQVGEGPDFGKLFLDDVD